MSDSKIANPSQAKSLFLDALQMMNEAMLVSETESVVARFYGSGDSGQVEEIELSDELRALDAKFIYIRPVISGSRWFNKEKEAASFHHYSALSAEQFFAQLSDDLLDMTGMDYANNEGGQGDVTFTATEEGLTWHIDFGVNTEEGDVKEYDAEHFFGVLGEPLDETQQEQV